MTQGKLFETRKPDPFAMTDDLLRQISARKQRAVEIRRALDAEGPRTVVLVACAASKAESPCRAHDLYTSIWFRKARAFAEARGDGWYILSAMHELLHPEIVIAPYNMTLKSFDRRSRAGWAERVAASVRERVPAGSRLIILAGVTYRRDLEHLLSAKGYNVDVPMKGLGIGQQLQYMTRALKSGENGC